MMGSFAETLQIKIQESGKTNKEFAKEAFIKKNDLNAILYGETPDKFTLKKLSKGLNIDLEEIESWLPSDPQKIIPINKKFVKADFKSKPKSPLKASGRFCIRCWFREKIYVYDRVEMCHYTGIRQHMFGKGRGKKVSHILQCPLCKTCHKHFDEPKVKKSIELSEDFLFHIDLFIVQEYEAGNIIIKKEKT